MKRRRGLTLFATLLLSALSLPAMAQLTATAQEVGFKVSLQGENFTRAVNIFLLLTVLSLAPSFVMMMTSFTRIVIVLGFLKQAMGVQQAPSSRIIAGLALFLTFFIMQPVWDDIYTSAVIPFSKNEISEQAALERAAEPLRKFMVRQTRDACLETFLDLAHIEGPVKENDLPMRVVIPAFMVSELQTAYQMGFLIYLPFLVIDAVVSTFLMSMGMMMLPPTMVSLPFKLLLFVMVDGWNLVIRGLVSSFGL